MRVKFWGVRGSIPTPGRLTEKYGGNTACVEIKEKKNRVILDGGTGIRELGLSLVKEVPSETALLFSHTHWDHIQGLPFFQPFFTKGSTFRVFAPSVLTNRVEAILTQQMEQHVFPVPFAALSSKILFEALPKEGLQYGDLHISFFELNHPGQAFGYRISNGKETVVYATDNEIHRAKHKKAFKRTVKAVRGADFFIADAQYSSEEYLNNRVGWGHSTYEEAMAAAREAGVKKLALFHHDPMSDDITLGKRERSLRKKYRDISLFFARDGMAVDVASH